ncbi:MAG: hypothetical protein UV79_C0006G0008 [candidate division TM6 bacterium GW2011_GWF2_43_17]|nr:MAG: hypothetical protein UV79_C0006G0008 [candidate division TM6 bacterium GW2011_GWF2_43_17]
MRSSFLSICIGVLVFGQYHLVFSTGILQDFSQIQAALEKTVMPIKQTDLDIIAEKNGYGYKAANLFSLKQLLKIVNAQINVRTHYSFIVPDFVAISSDQTQKLLLSRGVDVAKQWQKIIHEVFPDEASKTMVFKEKHLPQIFFTKLNTLIINPIKSTFNAIAEDNKADLRLDQQADHLFKKLIKEVGEKNQRCMVRSSGREDTTELANAGGNETVANVMPKFSSISRAIGIVVGSYFSEKSLLQRLGAGDTTIFDLPMMPVLVQEMVGEAPDGMTPEGAIPRCGVMFTEEPEGGLSRITNYEKTSGISVIQASYGHNEGVVNSIVSVDTYYTIDSGYWFPVIRSKLFRLAPGAQSGQLVRKENPASMRKIPALSPEEVLILSVLASGLERFYQRPMDVEFVINRKEKLIAIVQARPIVHPVYAVQHSYLAKIPKGAFAGEVIGAAGGSVHILSNKTDFIAAKTIGEALSVYQQPGFNRSSVECILIGKHAPSTSHEATTFRSEGKPVIFLSDYKRLDNVLEQNGSVLVDTQRGAFVPYQGALKKLKEFISENIVVTGWVQYPIPALLSLVARRGMRHFFSVTKQASAIEGLLLLVNKEYVKKELDRLKTQNTGRAERQKLLLERFDYAINYQQPDNEIINGFSVALFGKSRLAEKRARKAANNVPLDDYAVEYLKLAEYALTPDLAKKWRDFILQDLAAASSEKKNTFLEFFAQIGRAHMLETWLHAVFATRKSLEEILDDYQDVDRAFIQKLIQMQALVEATSLEGLGDPKSFFKIWEYFKGSIIDYFISEEFGNQFLKSGQTGRIIALAVMRRLVDLFDLGLKTMSRSSLFQVVKDSDTNKLVQQRIIQDHDKGAAFVLMLQKYLVLLDVWWDLYNSVSLVLTQEKAPGYFYKMRDIGVLQNILKKKNIGIRQKDFESTGFNVTRGLIGYREGYAKGPESLEDLFTAIHQNLLSLLSYITKTVVGDAFLPDQLKPLHQKIMQFDRASLVGFAFNTGSLDLFYNWPQMVHSAFIQVHWSPEKKVLVSLHFYGVRDERWQRLSELAVLYSLKNELLPENNQVFQYGMDLAWIIDQSNPKEVDRLSNVMIAMSDESHMPISPTEFAQKNVPLKYWLFYPDMGSKEYSDSMVKSADTDTLTALRKKLLYDTDFQKRSIKKFDKSFTESSVARTIVTLWNEEAQRDPNARKDLLDFAEEHLLGEEGFFRDVAYALLKDAVGKNIAGSQKALVRGLSFWLRGEAHKYLSSQVIRAVGLLPDADFIQYVFELWEHRVELKNAKDFVFVNALISSFVSRKLPELQQSTCFDKLHDLLKKVDSPKIVKNLAGTYSTLITYLNSGENSWFFESANRVNATVIDAVDVAQRGSLVTPEKYTAELWQALFDISSRIDSSNRENIINAFLTLIKNVKSESIALAFKTFAEVFPQFLSIIKENERGVMLESIAQALTVVFNLVKPDVFDPALFRVVETALAVAIDKATQNFVIKMLALWGDSMDKNHQGAFIEFYEVVLVLRYFEKLSRDMQKSLLSQFFYYAEQDWLITALVDTESVDALSDIEASGISKELGFVDLADKINTLKAKVSIIGETDSDATVSDDDYSYLDNDDDE